MLDRVPPGSEDAPKSALDDECERELNPPVEGSMTPVWTAFGDSTMPVKSWFSTSSTSPPSSARSMDRTADEMCAFG